MHGSRARQGQTREGDSESHTPHTFVSLFEPLCASLPSMPEVSTCFRLVQDCADCSRWLAMLSLELKTDVQLSSLSGDLPRLERDHSGWVLGVATGLSRAAQGSMDGADDDDCLLVLIQ